MKRIVMCAITFVILALAATQVYAGWLIYSKPAYKGKVIDAETKEPIEGAVVVVTYQKNTIGVPESHTSVIAVREALTDKHGVFEIPSYTTFTQPLSTEDMATFIIYKPAYGNFPDYQIHPLGIRPMDQEVFFSKDTSKEGEMDMWVKGNRGPELRKSKVTFGVVELRKLKTRVERDKALSRADRSHELPCYKIKKLIRLVNEEYKNLGYSHQVREDCDEKN